jgi:hypothetical protein
MEKQERHHGFDILLLLTFSFIHQPFLSYLGRVIKISDPICADLHTITVLVGGTATDSLSELHES